MINVVRFTTTFVLVVAITSCVTSRNIEWTKNTNSTDEMIVAMFPVIPIDKLNEDAVQLLPEYDDSGSRDNSNPGLMFNMPIAAAVFSSAVLLICCCFCCTRLIVQWDVFRKTRGYHERSKKQRAVDIARTLKLTEPPPPPPQPPHICKEFDRIKK